MKTNRSRSSGRKISLLLLYLAVAAMLGVGFLWHPRSAAPQEQGVSSCSQAPKMDLSALIAAH